MITKEKNLIIKRTILIAFAGFLLPLLTACSEKTIKSPYTLSVNGKTISYLEGKRDIEDKLGEGTSTKVLLWDGYTYKDQINIRFNDDDKIRYIEVISYKVNTINGIKVGDSIDKVLKTYKHLDEHSSGYSVVFSGDQEIDKESIIQNEINEEDLLTWIDYRIDDNKLIEKITIFDQEFAYYFK